MKLYSHHKALSAAIHFTAKAEQPYEHIYGSLFSKHPMGYNFEILVKASADYKEKIKQVCNGLHDKYDHCLINNLSEFTDKVPTFEVVALEIFKQAKLKVDDPNLSVILRVDDRNWVEVKPNKKVQLTKSYKINCVHRHHNPDLTMDENKSLYGKCSAIHGHEYTVEVSLTGPLNEHGQVLSTDTLDKVVDENLISPFHKTYLNDEMGNTSGELISELFYKHLSSVLPSHLTFDLTLRETRKNSFVKLA